MKQKTKNSKLSLSLLLILAIISLIALLATYARYTGSFTASDKAYIATWNLTFTTPEDTIFAHQYEKNIVETISVGEGEDASSRYVLAPGVDGQFEVALLNKGDVAAEVTKIELSISDSNLPLQFKLSDGEWGTLAELNTAIQNKVNNLQKITENGSEPTVVENIYWQWPLDAADASETATKNATDTEYGLNSAAALAAENGERTEVTLIMNVEAQQVAPEKNS